MRRISVLAGLAILLAACAAGTDPGASSPGARSPDDRTPSPSVDPSSLAPASEQPSLVTAPTGERLTGVLGADSIEGGCGYLQASDGTRYEVKYPRDWTLSLSPLELRSPTGEVVARGGDEVTVVGEIATDMASICQIGPIFRATDVEL